MSLITDNILTWVTMVPLIGAIALWTVVRRASYARVFALAVTLVDFVLSLHLLPGAALLALRPKVN